MKIDFWNNGDLEEKLIEIGKFERIASMLKKAKTTIQQHQWHTQLVELLGENVAECLKRIYAIEPADAIDCCFNEIYSKLNKVRREYNLNKEKIIKIISEAMNNDLADSNAERPCNRLARYFTGVGDLKSFNGCGNKRELAYAEQFIRKENGTCFVDIAKLAEKMNDIEYAAIVYMNFRIMND